MVVDNIMVYEKTMNILYDYQIFALQAYGGISRYFLEVAARLPLLQRDTDISILAPVYINRGLKDTPVAKRGIFIPEFKGKHRILPFFNEKMTQSFLTRNMVDIIHETYYRNRGYTASAKRVITVHDMIHEKYPQYFTGPDLDVPRKKLRAVLQADHIIVVSRHTYNDLLEITGVDSDKVSVIYHGSSIVPDMKRVGQDESSSPYLLYVGLRNSVKNFKRLVEAYSTSKQLKKTHRIICVGGGPFSREEKQFFSERGVLESVVKIVADDKKLAQLYGNASALVYPSLYEGFGLPLVEAMRCGCPVCCSNVSSMPEVAGEAAAYFDPLQVDNIREVLESVVYSDAARKSMQEQGFMRGKIFDWDECARKTYEVYANL